MKHCSNCGTPLEDDALFCSDCGNKVEMAATEDIQPELQDIQNVQQETETGQAAMALEEVATETNETPETEEKNSRIWGLVGLAAFLFLGGFGYCPWYIWIVVGLLALTTLAGMYKGFQIVCAIIVILFGTPVLFNNESKQSETYTQSSSSSSSNNSIAGPSWIDGTWVFKGYDGGHYLDVCVKINREDRHVLIVSNIFGTESGSYSVSGSTIRMSDGTLLYIDESRRKISLGDDLYLNKR